MRSREQVRRRQQERAEHGDKNRVRLPLAQQKPSQQADSRRNRGRGQRDDAKPTSNRVCYRKRDLREPLERNPVCSAKVCRERIGCWNSVVLENPATKRNVRISVWIPRS